MAYVTLRRADPLTFLTVDRPPANALDLDLLGELVAALRELAADPPLALVLAGREGCFSAGADLKQVPGYGHEQQRQMVHAINEMALTTFSLPCPVVAAVTGHAIAGGLVLAICADHRVASTEGRYGLTEVKVGVPYPKAAIGVVGAELAPHAARRLALGSHLTDAVQCVALGVFDEALAPAGVLGRAVEVAEQLAGFPADVYTHTKLELRGATIARIQAEVADDPLLHAWLDD